LLKKWRIQNPPKRDLPDSLRTNLEDLEWWIGLFLKHHESSKGEKLKVGLKVLLFNVISEIRNYTGDVTEYSLFLRCFILISSHKKHVTP